MSKNLKKLFLLIAMIATSIVCLAFSASAASEGYYTYNVSNGEAEITDVDTSISGDIVIPSNLGGYKVTKIGNFAFEDCTDLTSITVPDRITSIGYSAFKNCANLTYTTISNSVASIGSSAFYGCSSLTSITIPNSVTSINSYTFNGCSSLLNITIPNGVTSIGSSAFYGCSSLTNITIPNTVTSIDSDAFRRCSNLLSVTIPNNTTSIGHSAFHSCSSLTSITIPNSVTSIGPFAFKDCSSLISVAIPNGVTSINYNTFENCTSITSVIISNTVTSIGDSAFSGCLNLSNISIPDSVTSVGTFAFNNCQSLTNIIIPDNVTTIGSYTFNSCTNLISITLTDSLKSIGRDAFGDCTNLKYVFYKGTEHQKKNIAITVDGNDKLLSSIWHYQSTDHNWTNTCNAICNICGETKGESSEHKYHWYHTDSMGNNAYDLLCNECGENFGRAYLNNDNQYYIYGYNENGIFYHYYYNENAECLGSEKCDINFLISDDEYHQGICKCHLMFEEEPHSYDDIAIEKATTSNNGEIITKCSCGKVESSDIIPKISSVTLSKTNYIYDGKNKTPKVTVKDAEGNTLVKNVDYKTSVASKRSGIGRYTVKVTFIGNYSGSKNVYFYIKPGKPATVKSASQTTSSIKLSWSAVEGAAGYTVYRYSPSKKAYVKAGTTEGTSYTVKSLYAGTKYTFRVVAYGKTSAGKVYESDSYALLKTATKTKTPTLSKVTTTKGKAVLTHTNVSGETGYTVYYSTKKDSGFKKYANFKSDTTTCNITKLTSGKTYYFKVRTYIKTNSGYVYSDWSNIKSVKVK